MNIFSIVESKIQNDYKWTITDLETDITSNALSCLYFATQEQITTLIEAGKIDSDIDYVYQTYQTEISSMLFDS